MPPSRSSPAPIPEALELIRHDAAHVMAEAVQALWPGTQVTIGPVIENGFFYDFAKEEPFHPDDLAKIEAKMHEIIARNAPFTKEFWSRRAGQGLLQEEGRAVQDRAGRRHPRGRGPEDLQAGRVARPVPRPAHDLDRADRQGLQAHPASPAPTGAAIAQGAKLQRIYGTAWATEPELATYLKQLEEAEKRDHRKLGREMDLFHFQEEGPGVVFWHPKGWELFQSLINYMRRRQNAVGYREVNGPQILDKSLWETSGHWETFRENMFTTVTEDEREFAIKPMNCPGHVQIFKHGLRSYRELPYRVAEFGIVHRYEPSGALHGLMRVRGFTQDDAHVFCTDDAAGRRVHEDERPDPVDLSRLRLRGGGGQAVDPAREARRRRRAVGPGRSRHVGRAEADRARKSGGKIKTGINPGEGAFYGPKFEYVLRDAIGRDWQCGTTQVDFNLPGRFGAFYIDADGEKKTPVMIHRAIFGSMERFAGILLENTAGHLPLWLAPVQAKVCTIVSDADAYAEEVLAALKQAGLRAEVDLRNEKINYKVREHSLAKVPVMLVVGKREAEEKTVSVRRLGVQQQQVMPLAEAMALLTDEAVPPDLRRASTAAAA